MMVGSCELCGIAAVRAVHGWTAGVALVDDGHPVVPRHRLLVSTEHAPSFAALGLAACEWADLRRLASSTEPSGVLCYEHGNAGWNASDRPSVDHAHVHVVPLGSSTSALVSGLLAAVPWTRASDIRSVWRHCKGSGYHLIELGRGETLFTRRTLPSQIFRRECAIAHGVDDWNWRIS